LLHLDEVLGELAGLDARMGTEWPLEACQMRAHLVGEVGRICGESPLIAASRQEQIMALAARTATIAAQLRERRAGLQQTMQDLETEKRQLRAFDTEAAASSSLLDRLA
jgi:hypothetical protein